jgi:hypothetical protein
VCGIVASPVSKEGQPSIGAEHPREILGKVLQKFRKVRPSSSEIAEHVARSFINTSARQCFLMLGFNFLYAFLFFVIYIWILTFCSLVHLAGKLAWIGAMILVILTWNVRMTQTTSREVKN